MNKIETFPNAVIVKTHNKKVCVFDIEDSIGLQFLTVSEDLKPRAKHRVLKDKVVVTTLSLSKEGAVSLYAALYEYLQIKGVGYSITNEQPK